MRALVLGTVLACGLAHFHRAPSAALQQHGKKLLRSSGEPVGPYKPWGLHLAYGLDPQTSMQAMWATRLPVQNAVLFFGTTPGALTSSVSGDSWLLNDTSCGSLLWMHHASIVDLQPGTRYYYAVGDGLGNTSSTFNFKTLSADPAYQPTCA